jgi:hypothetical protein
MDKNTIADALQGKRLFIATPCYGGQAYSGYVQALVGFTRMAADIGFPFHLFTSTNESLVTRARNRCVAAFLESDSTHLMFIDSDIGFEPFSIFQLLLRDEDVVVASYPVKSVNWDALVGREFSTVAELQDASFKHVVYNIADPEESGLREVGDAGTGFMLIKREVIEQMIAAHPEWTYNHDEGGVWHAIFDCEIDGGRYLSEDYTFCRRWQRMGGRIMLDPMISLTHTGTYRFGFS